MSAFMTCHLYNLLFYFLLFLFFISILKFIYLFVLVFLLQFICNMSPMFFTLIPQAQLTARTHNMCTHLLTLGQFGVNRSSNVYIRSAGYVNERIYTFAVVKVLNHLCIFCYILKMIMIFNLLLLHMLARYKCEVIVCFL